MRRTETEFGDLGLVRRDGIELGSIGRVERGECDVSSRDPAENGAIGRISGSVDVDESEREFRIGRCIYGR